MKGNGAISLRRTLVHASLFALAAASAQSHAQINFQDLLKKAQQAVQAKPATPPPAKSQQQPQQQPSQAATAAPPPSATLPEESKATLDVLGVKLGASGLLEARAALDKVIPPLQFEVYQVVLSGQMTAGRGMSQVKEVPNTKHVQSLTGLTRPFSNHCAEPRDNGICEEIRVLFSDPPNKDLALTIYRQVLFGAGPTVDNLTRSLVEKYGQPGYSKTSGDRGPHREYAWAWSGEGTPVALSEGHACRYGASAAQATSLNGRQDNALSALRAGCAVVLQVAIQSENSVVKYVQFQGADLFNLYRTHVKTIRFVGEAMRAFEKEEREKAGAVAAPKL